MNKFLNKKSNNKFVTCKNAYAIIEYAEEKSVESVLVFKSEHTVNEKNLKVTRRQLKEFVSRINNNVDKKKEIMDKLKEEALVVNTLLGKCETVNIFKTFMHTFTHKIGVPCLIASLGVDHFYKQTN